MLGEGAGRGYGGLRLRHFIFCAIWGCRDFYVGGAMRTPPAPARDVLGSSLSSNGWRCVALIAQSRALPLKVWMSSAAALATCGAATLVPFMRTHDPLLEPALITPRRTGLSSPFAVRSGPIRYGFGATEEGLRGPADE